MNKHERTEKAEQARIPLRPIVSKPHERSSLAERAASASRSGPGPEQGSARPQDGVYIISVAARILRMHPQTLRKYERIGLVRPSRTMGMLRLYSEEDITKLRMIKHLVDEIRLNLAGVELAMSMVERLMAFRQRLTPRRTTHVTALQREVEEILDLFRGR